MRRITATAITSMIATATALVAFAPIALAADLEETRDAVWDVVWQADASNQLIILDFLSDGLAAGSRDELVSARDRANAALDSVWYSSVAQLDDLLSLFPGELADDVASATSRLLSDHDAAHAEIADVFSELEAGFRSPGPTTTTTTAPTTTTTSGTTTSTTAPSTTTTTTASTTSSSTTTTTTPPTTTTTTTASTTSSSTTTTTAPSTTTTRPPAAAGTTEPRGPSDPTRTGTDAMSMATLLGVDDSAFDLPGADEGSSASGEAAAARASGIPDVAAMGNGSAPVSRMMVEIGETIQIPDRLVQFTVAPVVMAEVLFGILFESLSSLVVPVAVLMVAVGLFVWRERRRPRDVGLA